MPTRLPGCNIPKTSIFPWQGDIQLPKSRWDLWLQKQYTHWGTVQLEARSLNLLWQWLYSWNSGQRCIGKAAKGDPYSFAHSRDGPSSIASLRHTQARRAFLRARESV